MRAACSIYEHPQLSYSEVWDKDAYNRSGTARVLTVLGTLTFITTITTFAIAYYSGILDVRTLQSM
jgi:hypothetical protein